MRDSFLTKIAIVLVVIVAFIDGILVANHFHEKTESVEALEVVELESLFELYEETEEVPTEVMEVSQPLPPFTSQAPAGDWKSPWSDFAEEAVMAMVTSWKEGKTELTREEAEDLMQQMALYLDSSKLASLAQIQEVLESHFDLSATILEAPSVEALTEALEAGSLVVVPVNGQILLNPHYGDPAPEQHMVLLYAVQGEFFLAHDPGTRRGEATLYDKEKILESVQDLEGRVQVLIIPPSL